MNTSFLFFRGLALCGAAFALAFSAQAKDSVSHSDKRFFEKAAKSGAEEIAVSEAALPHLTDLQAKQFASMMVSDHSMASQELQALANRKGVMLPAKQPDTKKWMEAKSRHYDEDYIEKMVKDHEDAVDLFTKVSKKGDDPEVTTFATKMLPTLQSHLDQAKAIKQALKR